jgi:hypothetical protein
MEQEKVQEEKANEKHTVKTFYDLDNKKGGSSKVGVTGLINPDMKDMYSLGVTKFSQERLESLAAPVSKEALKAVTELKQKKDAEKDGAVVFDKQVQLVKKLEK